jgi:MFS family permease
LRVVSRDGRLILVAQALRGFVYGLGTVLLGTVLHERGFSGAEAGVVLAAVVGGTVSTSLLVAWRADRWGHRRMYAFLYVLLAVVAAVFAMAGEAWMLCIAALAGVLSTEVVDAGPFTSLEQAMLAADMEGRRLVRGLGSYNAVATAAGSLGALAAGGLGPLRDLWSGAPSDQRAFWLFVPIALVGAHVARRLSSAVEPPARTTTTRPLGDSRPTVMRLSALFATDSFGGGFFVQSFIAYWFATKFDASVGTLGIVFFVVGLLQTASLLAAPRIAERAGLLPTMVFTHLPANLLMMALAFAPNLTVAVALLFSRVLLSQMDVPTRQAYVMALVEPHERTAAAVYTNTARYLVRPLGPLLGGASQSIALGAPFVIGGAIKGAYDLVLWRWFRGVEVGETHRS